MQKIKELMSKNVQVISPDQTIQEAAHHMLEGNFGMMPVSENDRMIGSISDRSRHHDLLRRAAGAARLGSTSTGPHQSHQERRGSFVRRRNVARHRNPVEAAGAAHGNGNPCAGPWRGDLTRTPAHHL